MAINKDEDKRDYATSAEALKTILTILGGLSESDRDRVVQSVIKFFNIFCA